MSEVEGDSQWRIVARCLTIWIVLMVAEVVHGFLRAIVLVPIVGEFRSNQIGVFTGSAIMLLIAYCTIRWIGSNRPSELLLVGLIWLLLTVAFEVLFGRLVLGLSWKRIASDYNVQKFGLMPLGLLLLFLSPMIALRLRTQRK